MHTPLILITYKHGILVTFIVVNNIFSSSTSPHIHHIPPLTWWTLGCCNSYWSGKWKLACWNQIPAKAVGFTPRSLRKFCEVHKKQSLKCNCCFNHKIGAFLTNSNSILYESTLLWFWLTLGRKFHLWHCVTTFWINNHFLS